MLIRNPSEFEHVARDWAVKHAGAQKKEIAESSGGATAESIKKKALQAKENEAKVKLAAYVILFLFSRLDHWLTLLVVITATTKISWTDLWPWASTLRASFLRLNMLVLIRWGVKITS